MAEPMSWDSLQSFLAVVRAGRLTIAARQGYSEDMLYAPELDYLPLVSRDIRPSFTSSNLVVQFTAACAGHGLCVLPSFMAAEEPRLAHVLAECVSLTRAFWLIVHADRRDLARVRVAADFITQEARNAQGRFLR